jgi:hypothetical protein
MMSTQNLYATELPDHMLPNKEEQILKQESQDRSLFVSEDAWEEARTEEKLPLLQDLELTPPPNTGVHCPPELESTISEVIAKTRQVPEEQTPASTDEHIPHRRATCWPSQGHINPN